MTSLRWGDVRYAPVVRRRDGAFEVDLDGRAFRFEMVEEQPGVFLLREGARGVRFHLAREGAKVHLFWDGAAWELEEEREGAPPARRQQHGALEAPMPGRVVAVRVGPGQAVRRGEELVVVEAMKMENALRAPRDGVVSAVHAAVDDMVAPGRALVELEPEA